MLYGRHPTFPQDITASEPKVGTTTHEYVRNLQQQLATAHDRLARITVKLRARMKSYYDRHRVDMEYEVNDLVLVFYPPLENSKVFFSWRGPFEIIEKVTPLTYRLRNLATGEVCDDLANINRLAKYHKAEHETLLMKGEGRPADEATASVDTAESPKAPEKCSRHVPKKQRTC